MEQLTGSQYLILQIVITVVPVGVAYIKQRSDLVSLRARVEELERENEELKLENKQLTDAHNSLRKRYEDNLKAQAGMRDKF